MINELHKQPVQIVIAGGGFAGYNLARHLLKNKDLFIILIDRNNYNYFPPLLYQVATGFLDASAISYPYRKLFRHERLSFRMAEVINVDTEAKNLILNNGEISYDYLVFSNGAQSNFFGIKSIQENAIPMKTIDDALSMRNMLFKTMEEASIATDPAEQETLLNIVVAGGGPTGVEITGMLAEIKKNIFQKEYPELKQVPSQIYIVDGGPCLLGPMSDKSHDDAYRILSDLGVKILLNTHVNEFSDRKVVLSSGEVINAKLLIWAAGVTATVFPGIPESSTGIGKRMITDEFNRVIGLRDVYAIGDCSIQYAHPEYPKGHPQLAQVAIQQGTNLALNFPAIIAGKPLSPFAYFDKGEMAIIGRQHAVVDLFKHRFHLKGIIALSAWLGVHLMSLVNPANKLRTLITWTIAYLSSDQSLRMIYRPERMPETAKKSEPAALPE
ncbi:MAG: NAD(P)/FAD-dependent oxidoreductase [Bacteroidota bacterium]|nr:NAD(P)/FAD-dependent oxidoreductase [Bacteroidota bacterium]